MSSRLPQSTTYACAVAPSVLHSAAVSSTPRCNGERPMQKEVSQLGDKSGRERTGEVSLKIKIHVQKALLVCTEVSRDTLLA